jgi:hypothetical protein
MPKTANSKREDFICGKVDNLVIDIKLLDITDELKDYLIAKIYDIQHDAQRMENKLIFRKLQAEEFKAEIRRLNTNNYENRNREKDL